MSPGLDRFVMAGQLHFSDPLLDLARELRRKLRDRTVLGLHIDGMPVIRFRLFRRLERRPQFDAALRRLAKRCVPNRGAVGCQAAARRLRRKDRVDECQHFRRRPARCGQRLVGEEPVCGLSARSMKNCRLTSNCAWIGALETEDRLFLVADGEDGARCVPRSPGEEFLGQACARSPTAPGSCPAPRRSGCGRGRRRACRAPRPPLRSA